MLGLLCVSFPPSPMCMVWLLWAVLYLGASDEQAVFFFFGLIAGFAGFSNVYELYSATTSINVAFPFLLKESYMINAWNFMPLITYIQPCNKKKKKKPLDVTIFL